MGVWERSIARCQMTEKIFRDRFPEVRFSWKAEKVTNGTSAEVEFLAGNPLITIYTREYPELILIDSIIMLFRLKYPHLPPALYAVVRKWLELEVDNL